MKESTAKAIRRLAFSQSNDVKFFPGTFSVYKGYKRQQRPSLCSAWPFIEKTIELNKTERVWLGTCRWDQTCWNTASIWCWFINQIGEDWNFTFWNCFCYCQSPFLPQRKVRGALTSNKERFIEVDACGLC